MPTDNIERAIKRGAGELGGEDLEEMVFEAFGPAGIAIIIKSITDNKNRTLGEVKQILNQRGGKMANEGSVKWLFERKGVITIDPATAEQAIKDKDGLEMAAIESGAEDTYWQDTILLVYTRPEELEKVRKALEEKGVKAESTSLDWVAKEEVALSEEEKASCQKLFEALDENDSIQEIYSNLKT
jgi:YebC/PmpR family DNA-binding regulatory protein